MRDGGLGGDGGRVVGRGVVSRRRRGSGWSSKSSGGGMVSCSMSARCLRKNGSCLSCLRS